MWHVLVPTRYVQGKVLQVRHSRVFAIAAISTTLALALTACGQEKADSDTPAQSSSSAEATKPSAKLPNVKVSGAWSQAGDVCKIIDAGTASKALGYKGSLVAEYNADGLPAVNGRDYCHYTDDPNFVLLNVAVVGGMTADRWDQTVAEKVTVTQEAYDPKIQGVDKSYVNTAGQVLALKGDIMITVLNNTLDKKVTSDQAANLAATVAKLF